MKAFDFLQKSRPVEDWTTFVETDDALILLFKVVHFQFYLAQNLPTNFDSGKSLIEKGLVQPIQLREWLY